MQLFFIDESGTPPPKGKKTTNNFVMGGLIIPSSVWIKVNKEFEKVKNAYRFHGEVKWRFFAGKNHDIENPMITWDFEKRNNFRNELIAILTKYNSIKVITSYSNIEEAYSKNYIRDPDDIYWYCYKALVERFQYYLQEIARSTGSEQYGLIICDHREKSQDNRLRSLHHKMIYDNNSTSSRYTQLIETLFFAPSHLSMGIQFADIIAGSVFRHIEQGDDQCYTQILPLFRKNLFGTIKGFGLVKVPKK